MSNQELAQRVRDVLPKLRTTSVPLADLIPLLQQVADALQPAAQPRYGEALIPGSCPPAICGGGPPMDFERAVAYADKIAFEGAMRKGKGCDVWPSAGDYTQRTGRELVALTYAAPAQASEPSAAKFKLGDTVRKTKGSQWYGVVVGTYSTELTPEGYAVESSTEKGSVQIYPAAALEAAPARASEPSRTLPHRMTTDQFDELVDELRNTYGLEGDVDEMTSVVVRHVESLYVAAPARAFETFPEQWKEPVHAPARAVEPLTNSEIQDAVTDAHKNKQIIWAGFKKDAEGVYNIPVLSPADYKLAHAVIAAFCKKNGITPTPVA